VTTPEALTRHPLKGAECRGSKSACADLDGTRANRLWRLAPPAARQSRFRGRCWVVLR